MVIYEVCSFWENIVGQCIVGPYFWSKASYACVIFCPSKVVSVDYVFFHYVMVNVISLLLIQPLVLLPKRLILYLSVRLVYTILMWIVDPS